MASRQILMDETGPIWLKISKSIASVTSGLNSPTYKLAETGAGAETAAEVAAGAETAATDSEVVIFK